MHPINIEILLNTLQSTSVTDLRLVAKARRVPCTPARVGIYLASRGWERKRSTYSVVYHRPPAYVHPHVDTVAASINDACETEGLYNSDEFDRLAVNGCEEWDSAKKVEYWSQRLHMRSWWFHAEAGKWTSLLPPYAVAAAVAKWADKPMVSAQTIYSTIEMPYFGQWKVTPGQRFELEEHMSKLGYRRYPHKDNTNDDWYRSEMSNFLPPDTIPVRTVAKIPPCLEQAVVEAMRHIMTFEPFGYTLEKGMLVIEVNDRDFPGRTAMVKQFVNKILTANPDGRIP